MRFKQIFGSWRIYALSALKLAAVPLLAYAVLRHVLTNEFALCVLTVLLCMPIATNTTILSYQYGADETAASSGVFGQHASEPADDPADDEAAVRNISAKPHPAAAG